MARAEGEGGFAGLGARPHRVPGDRQRAVSGARHFGRPGLTALTTASPASGAPGRAASAISSFPLRPSPLAAEARWREMSLDARDGLEVSAGSRLRVRGRRPPQAGTGRERRPRRSTDPPCPRPPVDTHAAAALRQAVIATATDAMGRPYQWGGTGEDGGGFDCSGLIQHAYAEHGIALPRTSAAQAGEGREVKRKGRSARAGRPADLLQPRRPGDPRGPLPRRRPLHPQRQPRGAGQPAERRRSLRPLVVSALGRGPPDHSRRRGCRRTSGWCDARLCGR